MSKNTDNKAGTDIEKLQEESAYNLAGWKRALADYHNFAKQVDSHSAKRVLDAEVSLMRDMTPIMEHLTLALQHVPESQHSEQWYIGLRHVLDEFSQFLEAQDVIIIEPQIGEPFNHDMHEAVDTTTEGDGPSQTITKVISPGYRLKDTLIKPALVIVQA